MSDGDKQTVRTLIQEVWGEGNLSRVDELVDPDVVIRIGNEPEPIVGIAAYRQFIAAYQALLGEIEFTIEDQLADGDKVVTRWTVRPAGADSASGVMGISIQRFANGRLAEAWDTWDSASLLDPDADSGGVLERVGVSL